MPTPKQEKLAKALVDNALSDKPDNLSNILDNVGYAPTTARKNQNEIIDAPGVQEAIKEYTSEMIGAMEAQGITPFAIAGKIKELLNAKKITKVAGQIESIEDNYQAIDKGITHAAKFGIGGGYKTNDQPIAQQNVQINIFNKPEVREIVADFEEKLKAELTKHEEKN